MCFLLYNLLTLSDDIKPFEAVNGYLKPILDNLSCFSLELLIYLGEASNHRALLPPQQLILEYLQSDISASIPPLALLQLSQLMQNYLRFSENSSLYMAFTHWISARLRAPTTPVPMRIDLLRLLTTLLNTNDQDYIQNVAGFEVWLEVTTLARFGHEEEKHASLECLSVLVRVLPPRELETFVESHLILEVLIYGLDMGLADELKYKMLLGLGVVLELLPKLRKIARGLGLLRVVGRLGGGGNVKLTTVALDIRKLYE